MEWNLFLTLSTIVGFMGGFIAGSWKLSSMITRMEERMSSIDDKMATMQGNVEILLDYRFTIENLKSRVERVEEEYKELKEIINKIQEHVGGFHDEQN